MPPKSSTERRTTEPVAATASPEPRSAEAATLSIRMSEPSSGKRYPRMATGVSQANTVEIPPAALRAGVRIATAVADDRSSGGAVAPAAGAASEPAPPARTADAPSAAFQSRLTSPPPPAHPPPNHTGSQPLPPRQNN